MSEPTSIAVDQFLAHPPAKVWRALTDSDLLARWLMPNDFGPVPGHRFTFHTAPRSALTPTPSPPLRCGAGRPPGVLARRRWIREALWS
ncbi:SRPBCC family protein [Micromonospora sp. SL1-18]|uniref:SRPBCC family protein n=1 Tax=Micromonospora sp. SL1-18 TaxID=3399128 RepID=UPI003A4D77C3